MEKIIHQMWFQGIESVPEKYFLNIKKWKKFHPNYKYFFWDESSIKRFLKKFYPNYIDAWNNLDKFIKKCDCSRYFILHHYGGIYADLDTIPLKPIEQLITDENLYGYQIILSEENNNPNVWKSEFTRRIRRETQLKTIVGNAILLSKKRASFWINFVEKSFQKKHMNVLESFSTWHLTKFISEYKDPNIKIIPHNFLLGSDKTVENAYAIHEYDATWFNYNIEKPWEG